MVRTEGVRKTRLRPGEAEPVESTNLIDDPALQEVAAEMRTKVRRFRMETRDPWVLAARQTGEEGLEGGVA